MRQVRKVLGIEQGSKHNIKNPTLIETYIPIWHTEKHIQFFQVTENTLKEKKNEGKRHREQEDRGAPIL